MSNGVAKPKGSRKSGGFSWDERVVLLSLAAVQFTSIVDFMVVMPLGPQLMRSLRIEPDQFGLVVASYTFAAGIAGLAASSLVDRFDRKTAFLGLYTGFLVGTLLCGFAPTYIALVAARVATGMFGGLLGGMALAIIGDVFPENRRGQATGILMSAFALASVVGVPFGLYLGLKLGWHAPFIVLAILGLPILVVAWRFMPSFRDHIQLASRKHPIRSLIDTFSYANHLNAFALVIALMAGGFSVIPYISPYLVFNVGVTEAQLPLVYIAGGGLTLFVAPLIGKLADRFGKLLVYQIVAPISALLMVLTTNLPRVALFVAVATVASLMVSNAGRMVAALAMVTGSVLPERRGGFMSANSSVQHLATGFGASLGGMIIKGGENKPLIHFDRVGWIAMTLTLLSIYLASRLKPATRERKAITPEQSLAAAAEALCDAGEPLAEF
jgi:MFS transporter, DHA1 family, inner membrane transport protein